MVQRQLAERGLHAVVVSVPRNEVGIANKSCEPASGRALIQLGGWSNLQQVAFVEDSHFVSEHKSLVLIMGDKHRGHSKPKEQLMNLGSDLHAKRGIKV